MISFHLLSFLADTYCLDYRKPKTNHFLTLMPEEKSVFVIYFVLKCQVKDRLK